MATKDAKNGEIDAEGLIFEIQQEPQQGTEEQHALLRSLTEEYQDGTVMPAPKFRMRNKPMIPEQAASTVRRHLTLDGKPALNLASFVTTHIDEHALALSSENITKNLADNDEYPAMIALHQRCVSMLGNLWNAQDHDSPIGTATTGSSEAIQLAGLAMKRRWEARRKAKNLPYDKPNIVMGANAQVALEKFARYFDVELRLLDVNAKDHFNFNADDMVKNIDENTIGVFAILGSTYTGHYADIQAVSDALDKLEKEKGLDIDIHVDGASGAFVAPFCTPDYMWDFRMPRVKSINTSGHKFGLCPVGCGWVVFRDRKYLPNELLFKLNYLGGSELTFTLNFSRPGHPIIVQYYLLIKNGYIGYRDTHSSTLKNARLLSLFLEKTGVYEVLSDIHRPKGVYYPEPQTEIHRNKEPTFFNPGLPVVAFRFNEKFRKEHPEVPQEAISFLLRHKGYIIPNYPMPPSIDNMEVLRVVVNAGLTADFMDQLMEDIGKVTNRVVKLKGSLGKLINDTAVHDTLRIMVDPDDEEEEHEDLWTTQSHSRC